LGGASVAYWAAIAERHRLDLEVVNPLVDATFRFMTLDWDGKIRMDCSSPNAMASLIARRQEYQIATGNDADADRHGIVTPDGSVWTTDKDGILLCLLASEIQAVTGRSPSQHYADLAARFGDPSYARVDAPATRAEKAVLGKLSPAQVTATSLAGEEITGIL